MVTKSLAFGLELTNIPPINLRDEFNRTYRFVYSATFSEAMGPVIYPIHAPPAVWLGMPDDFATFVVQRAVLGLESYLPAAVYVEAGLRGRLTPELGLKLRNPFSFKKRAGTVEAFYHMLPSALDPGASLKVMHAELWNRTSKFYREIRNPLFHGKQLHKPSLEGIRGVFDLLAQLYEWIDEWHSLESVIKGGSVFSNVRRKVSPNRAP